ncbi:hypothetical protein V8G54_025046, partial [Vigna mungo]
APLLTCPHNAFDSLKQIVIEIRRQLASSCGYFLEAVVVSEQCMPLPAALREVALHIQGCVVLGDDVPLLVGGERDEAVGFHRCDFVPQNERLDDAPIWSLWGARATKPTSRT